MVSEHPINHEPYVVCKVEVKSWFLRATAVPAGTAEARISYGDSVCLLSVCLSARHNPVPNQA